MKPKCPKKAKAVRIPLFCDEDDSVPISETENEENLPCGFSGVKYFEEKSVLKGEWIGSQRCNTWSYGACVGALGKKQFIYAKYMSG
jgi:ribosomal protein L27